MPARELKERDNLLLSDGSKVEIDSLRIEHVEIPETTYNFEVKDFHTYYVSHSNVLVHNKCGVYLYRGGSDMTVRNIDVKIIDDLVQPQRGISVNSNPNAVKSFGGAYKIGKLPEGLKIKYTGGTHYEIIPKYAMPLDVYQELLWQIPLIPMGG